MTTRFVNRAPGIGKAEREERRLGVGGRLGIAALVILVVALRSIAQAAPAELLADPGFEHGLATESWLLSNGKGAPLIVEGEKAGVVPHSGGWMAALGGTNDDQDVVRQFVIVPIGSVAANVSFWWNAKATGSGSDPSPHDTLTARIADFDGNPLMTLAILEAGQGSSWMMAGPFDVSSLRGEVVQLVFEAVTNKTKPTSFFVDDASFSFLPGTLADLDLAFINPRTRCIIDGPPLPIDLTGLVPIKVTASASSGVQTLRLRLDGGEVAVEAGARLLWYLDSDALSAGEHSLEAEAVAEDGLRRLCRARIRPAKLLRNGGFEEGSKYWTLERLASWAFLFAAEDGAAPFEGQSVPAFGFWAQPAVVSQPVSIPLRAGTMTVSYFAKVVSSATPTRRNTLSVDLVDPFGVDPPISLGSLSDLDSVSEPITSPSGYSLHRYDFGPSEAGVAGKIRVFRIATEPWSDETRFLVDGIGITAPLLEQPAAGPTIWIETPSPGEVVMSQTLLVSGWASSTTGSFGVSIDGLAAAAIDRTHAGTPEDPAPWSATVSLEPGETRIVRAIVSDGVRSDCAEVEVRAAAELPWRLEARPPMLVDSGEVTLEIESPVLPGGTLSLDCDGDGIDDATWSWNERRETNPCAYSMTGRYVVTLSGWDAGGAPAGYAQTVVMVLPSASVTTEVQARWSTLLSSLLSGDLEGVVSSFGTAARGEYRWLFERLAGHGPGLLADLAADLSASPLVFERFEPPNFVFRAETTAQVESGLARAPHEMVFAPDVDGVLRLVQF